MNKSFALSCFVLLAANFGRNKNNEAKQRKVAVEYVRLCGYDHGGDRQSKVQNGLLLSLDEIATQLGISKTNLKRALSIERNLTEPMKKLLDAGTITKTLAADVISSKDIEKLGSQNEPRLKQKIKGRFRSH